ncbi:YaiI/YqxD family protein [Candidatus Izimaplasma sp. HR1]|uniref:YaiI/YqxD family protein n=1 Tax=Candidatus Izimoplasma sp. HR1 TaxID=1541959 RepID=UPI00056F9DF5
MRIMVDADACPVKEIIIKLAKKYELEVHMFFDNSHVYKDGYSTVYILDKGADSVDYALINKSFKGDIVVTQDYGVATMALSKRAYPINQNGLIYNDDNIMSLLTQRATNQKLRKHKKMKGPRKRTKEMDIKFEQSLYLLINSKL